MQDEAPFTELSDGLGLIATIVAGAPLTELTAEVNSACDRAERRGDASALVLRLASADTAACEDWPGRVTVSEVNRWERALHRIERLPAVSIAAAAGACGGPALDLLLVADYRIGAPDLLLQLPVNDGHFWPGMALFRLVQEVGVARARQVVLWGNTLAAAEVCRLGLIDQISDNLVEAVHTAAVLKGRISNRELSVRRQLLIEAASSEYDEAIGIHLAACDRELRRLADRMDVAAMEPAGTASA